MPGTKRYTTIQKLLDYSENTIKKMKLKLLNKGGCLTKEIYNASINRPGLPLYGFYEYFVPERVQLLGRGEAAYIEKLYQDEKAENIVKFLSSGIPVVIFSHNYRPDERFLKTASENQVPVLVSGLPSSDLTNLLEHFLLKMLAPKIVMHGVMMELYGMGIMLEGESPIGKSECAIELIERGHRIIADDVIDVRLVDDKILKATSSAVISHHMEIRGIGIINIANLFGVRAIRKEINVDLIVHFEPFDQTKKYDRLGMNTEYREVMGINIPIVTIPIHPGSNMPVLVETAAMNHRLKQVGYNTAHEFNKKLTTLIQSGDEM